MDEIEDCIRLLQWRLLAPLLVETRNVCLCAASPPTLATLKFHAAGSTAGPAFQLALGCFHPHDLDQELHTVVGHTSGRPATTGIGQW